MRSPFQNEFYVLVSGLGPVCGAIEACCSSTVFVQCMNAETTGPPCKFQHLTGGVVQAATADDGGKHQATTLEIHVVLGTIRHSPRRSRSPLEGFSGGDGKLRPLIHIAITSLQYPQKFSGVMAPFCNGTVNGTVPRNPPSSPRLYPPIGSLPHPSAG